MATLSLETSDNRKAKAAAKAFSKKWLAEAGDEKQETSRFWMELLRSVFGVENPEDLIRFEVKVDLSHQSYIDAHIPTTRVVIEQKSAGVDLGAAKKQSDGAVLTPYQQAKRYSDNLPVDEHARWIVTCNFREFRIHDMSLRKPAEPVGIITLEELPEQYHRLGFLVDTQRVRVEKEKHVSMQAGELISKIYNALLDSATASGVTGPNVLQALNKFCVRLVFCLYAEDAGLFKRDQFLAYIQASPNPAELRARLLRLFVALNRPVEERDPFDLELRAFPYVNGGLFADEAMFIPMMDENIRDLIQDKASAGFDWKDISPTIFGGLFESTLNPETRRSGGMHYTSIENIHKVIDPLFMDALRAEFMAIKHSDKGAKTRKNQLMALQDKLAGLVILDPACGSGNFLTESYISLRRLENDILREALTLEKDQGQTQMLLTKVDIRQFHGIEINDFAVSVAKTALWIADAQMWEETQDILHNPSAFLPLKQYEGIREANALQVDWLEHIPGRRVDYIIGNPPFVGARMMDQGSPQKLEVERIFGDIKDVQDLDYVTCWYKRAAQYIQGSRTQVGFVSTNSICQGSQVPILWHVLLDDYKVQINFAHTTFKWNNEAKGTAAVHCVIVGFGVEPLPRKMLYVYETPTSEPEARECVGISPYLTPGDNIFAVAQKTPLCDVPEMKFGSQPRDGGFFILSPEERDEVLTKEPQLESVIHQYVGADEFIKGKLRYCIWLHNEPVKLILKSKILQERIAAVEQFRLDSKAKTTRNYAKTPAIFAQIAHPYSDYLIVPRVSSENREYVPIGFMSSDTIASDAVQIVPNASLYHFGVLTSAMHMAWMRAVAGRLKSDYRYSKEIVYNTFPWPECDQAAKEKVEEAARKILELREQCEDVSLAKMYEPVAMKVTGLLAAHRALDAAVDKAYGRKFKDDADRVAHLFKLYKKLTEGK